MKDFRDADYAIRMKEYNKDGTEKEINKFIKTYDQQIDRMKDLGPNEVLDKFGNILMRDNYAPEQQVTREKAKSLASGFKGFGTGSSKSINKSQSRRSGRSDSRSKGGISRGTSKSNSGSKRSARGARGGSTGGGSSSKGGTSKGGARTNRSRSRRRCDIRCKIDVSPLVSFNLVNDELAKLAYFVQEINK